MGVLRILNEYIKRYEGKGFKGYEYFKHVITASGAKWIEDQIANSLDNSRAILNHENKLIHSNGSQYIQFHYKGNKENLLILRLSTHEEDKNFSDNSHYSIDAWNDSPRQIKEHINSFIDYAVVYFSVVDKKSEGKPLEDHEKEVYNTVKDGESFHEPNTYPSLEVVHRKAVKKKMNKSSPNLIRLP